MAAGGAHDSQGQFTLSLEKAADKLKKFQLTNPNLFMLNLVAAASVGGADRFSVVCEGQSVEVEFDGRLVSPAELGSLFYSDDPFLKELVVAITAARSLNPDILQFESGGSLDWTGETPLFGTAASRVNTFRLVYRGGLNKNSPTNSYWVQPWEKPLRASSLYCTFPVYLNHRRINSYSLHVQAPAFALDHPEFRLPHLTRVGDKSCQIARFESPGRFSAVVGDQTSSWAEEWSFVVRGITFSRPSTLVAGLRLGGVVVSDLIKKNLSHSDLVEDDAFREIVEYLEESILRFVWEKLSFIRLPHHKVTHWLPPARWASERLLELKQDRDAARIEAWAVGHQSLSWSDRVQYRTAFYSKYKEPLVFLMDFFHWGSLTNVEGKLRKLEVDFAPLKPYSSPLLPWIEGAEGPALLVLFEFLVPAFPREMSWETLVPLVARLSRTGHLSKVVAFISQRLKSVTVPADYRDLESLCKAASFLATHGALDYGAWLDGGIRTGVLLSSPELQQWVAASEHGEAGQKVLARYTEERRMKNIALAVGRFSLFLETPEEQFLRIQACLEAALPDTQDASERAHISVMASIFGSKAPLESSQEYAWQTHRAALVSAASGEFLAAGLLHEIAHGKLEGHWFSHLLLADNRLARGWVEKANDLYRRALELRKNSLDVREDVAETAPVGEQRSLWLELAHSLSTPRMEAFLAFREALSLTGKEADFLAWVRLRALTSYAEHRVGELPGHPSDTWIYDDSLFVWTSLRFPALVRAEIRRMRRAGPAVASRYRAKYRLIQQLSQATDAHFQWKQEFVDSPETRL